MTPFDDFAYLINHVLLGEEPVRPQWHTKTILPQSSIISKFLLDNWRLHSVDRNRRSIHCLHSMVLFSHPSEGKCRFVCVHMTDLLIYFFFRHYRKIVDTNNSHASQYSIRFQPSNKAITVKTAAQHKTTDWKANTRITVVLNIPEHRHRYRNNRTAISLMLKRNHKRRWRCSRSQQYINLP